MPRISLFILILFALTSACTPQTEPVGTSLTQTSPPVLPSRTVISNPTQTQGAHTKAPTKTATPLSQPEPKPISDSTNLPATTILLFTGVIVPARCVQAAIDARGGSDYLYEEVRPLIAQADLAIGTLNATLSDYPEHTGCVSTYVLVGSSDNAGAMSRAGFDLMSVATNHIKNCGLSNCGDRTFFDTLDNLRRAGIIPVGAGKDLAEAMQPVVVNLHDVRFGFVSLGQLEPLVFATADQPGIAVLNEENLRTAIATARRESDVVIVMPHWGPEDVPTPNWSQRELAQIAVEAGADLVVGNHTHVAQAVQEIAGVEVFYGLGNFVFDQNWALDHQQGVILKVTFDGQRMEGYEMVPIHVDGDGKVHLADQDEAAEILARIESASQDLR
jgi:poly-gamma-glutamate capsule biosynthesis protein CapA/YwtB (metallophosphatase superfamily)